MEGYVSEFIYTGQIRVFIYSSISYFVQLATLTMTQARRLSGACQVLSRATSYCLYNVTWHVSPDAVTLRSRTHSANKVAPKMTAPHAVLKRAANFVVAIFGFIDHKSAISASWKFLHLPYVITVLFRACVRLCVYVCHSMSPTLNSWTSWPIAMKFRMNTIAVANRPNLIHIFYFTRWFVEWEWHYRHVMQGPELVLSGRSL